MKCKRWAIVNKEAGDMGQPGEMTLVSLLGSGLCLGDKADYFNMTRFASRMIFPPGESQMRKGERLSEAGISIPHAHPHVGRVAAGTERRDRMWSLGTGSGGSQMTPR